MANVNRTTDHEWTSAPTLVRLHQAARALLGTPAARQELFDALLASVLNGDKAVQRRAALVGNGGKAGRYLPAVRFVLARGPRVLDAVRTDAGQLTDEDMLAKYRVSPVKQRVPGVLSAALRLLGRKIDYIETTTDEQTNKAKTASLTFSVKAAPIRDGAVLVKALFMIAGPAGARTLAGMAEQLVADAEAATETMNAERAVKAIGERDSARERMAAIRESRRIEKLGRGARAVAARIADDGKMVDVVIPLAGTGTVG